MYKFALHLAGGFHGCHIDHIAIKWQDEVRPAPPTAEMLARLHPKFKVTHEEPEKFTPTQAPSSLPGYPEYVRYIHQWIRYTSFFLAFTSIRLIDSLRITLLVANVLTTSRPKMYGGFPRCRRWLQWLLFGKHNRLGNVLQQRRRHGNIIEWHLRLPVQFGFHPDPEGSLSRFIPNPSAATALPTGCSARSFQGPENIPHVSGSFLGCTASVAGALQQCCSQVGSTPAFVNGTCGCPFNSVFTPALRSNWTTCVIQSSFAADSCNLVFKPNSALTVPLPLNAAVVFLGLSLMHLYAVKGIVIRRYRGAGLEND
ncbi:hypothetical protein B0H13DRAFT_1862912 [Mycena leptocephala]|nr:hypothetical protein B0H13DRAFT_1862912 [Mycena leptocephala]